VPGIVHLAYRRDTFEKCALKFVLKTYAVYDEVRIMQRLGHPNVVKFEKYISTPKYHVIVMEYASGKDLFSYVSKTSAN
jgi:serine/threonine protein kinase